MLTTGDVADEFYGRRPDNPVNEVAAQTGKKLTTAQAASFITQANNIKATLGCDPLRPPSGIGRRAPAGLPSFCARTPASSEPGRW